MAILLDAQQLTASFGARPLFEGVSFTVEDQERIGLIGPNGAGKSTLLRLIAEAEAASPDGGSRKLPDLRARQSAVSWCGGCVEH